MYPPHFDYLAAESLDEALGALAEHGDEAKLLSGGQSLIPLLKLRFAAPTMLVDLNRIDGLGGIDADGGQLRIGALARHNELANSALLAKRCPVMTEAGPLIADPLIRNLGTIGGSLAHADPAGDWGSVLLAAGADLVLTGSDGQRVVPIEDFFQGIFWTVLEPTEIITEIRVPLAGGAVGGAYMKLERKVGDFATVGAAIHLELSNGSIRKAGIALTAVGPTNLKVRDAEAVLTGAPPSDEAFAEAARLAAAAAEPNSDNRGSEKYKRNVVRVFVERGLRRALAMAQSA